MFIVSFAAVVLDLVAEEENTLLDETALRLLRKLDVFMTIKND